MKSKDFILFYYFFTIFCFANGYIDLYNLHNYNLILYKLNSEFFTKSYFFFLYSNCHLPIRQSSSSTICASLKFEFL